MAAWLESRGNNYKVITPYDAQRALLQKALKLAKLEWENKCFNVDSFQGTYTPLPELLSRTQPSTGNEESYIIVSLVRTERLGFLADKRRMNVMLTRCKRGMMICTNREFLEDVAEETLVGALAHEWYEQLGSDMWTEFEELP